MVDIARHATGSIDLNGVVISNIMGDSIAVNPQIQKSVQNAGGAILPTIGATLTAAPLINFTTHDIDLIDSPTKITAPTVLTFRAYDEATGFGSGYISLTVAAGLIVPESISANAAGEAVLSCAIYAISGDGDTNPVIVGTTSKVLAIHGDVYTVGNVNIGGAISGIQAANFNFGYNVTANTGENGKAFPTLSYIDKQDATATVETNQLSAATQARLNTGQSATTISITFAKLAEGAVPTADSYTITIPKAIVEAQSVSGGRPVSTSLMITPISSDGAAYVTFS